MEWKSKRIEGSPWRILPLSDRALLLQLEAPGLERVWAADRLLRRERIAGIVDIVPGYDSVAVSCDLQQFSLKALENWLQSLDWSKERLDQERGELYEIPVCYELGLDWDILEKLTGIGPEEYRQRHSQAEYRVAMTGFLPGFIYLDGLDPALACPRVSTPRVEVPDGAVAIGGDQTGIYSFPCPGGWRIIGRTPLRLFRSDRLPPLDLAPGDRVRFQPISEAEFEERLNHRPHDSD